MSNGVPELVDVLNEEYAKIDRRAKREKREINYIMYLVRKDYDKLIGVAGTDDGRTLFDFVREALRQTEEVYSPSDIAILHKEPGKKACLLGWIDGGMDVSELNALKSSPYTCLTDLGREVVEDYKKI